MYKLIILIPFLILHLSAFAQSDKEASQLAKKTSKRYTKAKGYTGYAEVQYKFYTKKDSFNYSSPCTFYFQGEKYRMNFDYMDIAFDGERRYVLLKDVNELQISYGKDDSDTNLLDLFLFINEANEFTFVENPFEEEYDQLYIQIHHPYFQQFVIGVSPRGRRLLNLYLQNESGEAIWVFKQISKKRKLPDELFQFEYDTIPNIQYDDVAPNTDKPKEDMLYLHGR